MGSWVPWAKNTCESHGDKIYMWLFSHRVPWSPMGHGIVHGIFGLGTEAQIVEMTQKNLDQYESQARGDFWIYGGNFLFIFLNYFPWEHLIAQRMRCYAIIVTTVHSKIITPVLGVSCLFRPEFKSGSFFGPLRSDFRTQRAFVDPKYLHSWN